jgi:hypothetical protein
MTEQELQNMSYWICCPMCDNKKCVRGAEECEAAQWVKKQAMRSKNEREIE